MTKELPLATDAGSSPFAWVYRFDKEGRAELLTEPPAEFPLPGEGFLWVHINLSDTRCRAWINAATMINAPAKIMLLDPDEHLRLSGNETWLWGTFVDFGRDLDKADTVFVPVKVVVGDGFMVSARRRPIQSAELTRNAIAGGECVTHPLELLEAVGERIINALGDSADKLTSEVDRIEDHVLEGIARGDGQRLGPLRRETVRLNRQVSGMHRIMARFDQPTKLSDQMHVTLQRLLQKLESIHHELHSTLERARLLNEEMAGKRAAETNRQLYILTILGTLLMPPTFITGIFGMNTKGLIFADHDNAFIYAMLMCLASAIAAYAMLLLLGRRRDTYSSDRASKK